MKVATEEFAKMLKSQADLSYLMSVLVIWSTGFYFSAVCDYPG